MDLPQPLVRMENITKRFAGVTANSSIDFDVRPGEVHALLGENGAGKSTLMNILYGLYRPDEGTIFANGRKRVFFSPRDALAAGIGMVHQHFMLIQSQTVWENMILGLKDLPFIIPKKTIRERILELSSRYGLEVQPDASVWQLSIGEQQRVAILQMLFRQAKILILDEPTAVLTPQESAELAKVIRLMKTEGKSAIFITHKMDEVMNFSDRVMVLRKGRVVAGLPTGSTSPSELARLMVGREMLFSIEKKPFSPGKTILMLDRACAKDDRGLTALKEVSLRIRSGEILGIAGVAGNGQKELAEVITGLRKLESGSLRLDERDMSQGSPIAMIKAGVAHVPQDRASVGSVGDLSVASNLAMKEYRKPSLSRGIFLFPRRITALAKRLIERFKIMTPGPDTHLKFLSGGNIQKTILAREIGACKSLLVAVYPSRGLDIGATESVRRQLVDQRDQGLGVLFVSEDIDELIQVADTIAVLFEGKIMAVMPSAQAEPERLGLLMAGVGA